jgi:hypothetical protein
MGFCNYRIKVVDEYIPEPDLLDFMSKSRSVLFTYSDESVLSSGALMDSLSYGMRIIAPYTGAFRDAKDDGLILTYKDNESLISLLEAVRNDGPGAERETIADFIEKNDWVSFSGKISGWIK